MTLRELAIAVGFNIDGKSENAVESSINGIKSMASKVLGAIGIGFSISGLSNLAEAAADAEALKSQFTQVFGELENDASEQLQGIADNTGILVNRMKGSFTQIAAFAKTTGMEEVEALNLANRSMKAVADSAAFYDRSMEEVTDSLQSFLKGNFENDAALGLSCTETTRNAAANKLYGKSFKDLAEDQKQLTLLQMVEDANKASGALGQAARESDTWTNQLGNLKQSVTDLKAEAGKTFLEPAVKVLKVLNTVVQKATLSISKMKPTIENIIRTVSNIATKTVNVLKTIVDKLGGTENTIKLVTIAISALVSTLSIMKIIKQVKLFASAWGSVGKAAMIAKLKLLGIIAIVALIFLVIDDFINFMQGNDSVIGTLLEKAGIDTEKVRDTIKSAWKTISTFLSNTWGKIKSVASTVWGGLKSFFSNNAGTIKGILLSAWKIISMVLSTLWDGISTIATAIFGDLQEFWDTWGETIMLSFQLFFQYIGQQFEYFLQILKGVLDFLVSVFTGDWEGAWEAVKSIFSAIWGSIKDTCSIIWEGIKSFIGTSIDAIKQKIFGMYEAIKEKVTGAVGFIKDLLGMGGSVDLSVSSATKAAAGIGGVSRSINQSNTITNNFNGGNPYDQQRASNAISKSGEDVTSSLRRSLANS